MIVEPSSALRCWTSEYRTPRLPHLGQSVFVSIRSVCTWCLSTVWTIESFCRSAEGKSDGFVRVVTVFHGWSASGQQTNLCAPCARLQTDLCSRLRSSRNGEYSSRCPWTEAEGCRSLCRKSETQLPPWCTQLCEQKLKKKKKTSRNRFVGQPRVSAVGS